MLVSLTLARVNTSRQQKQTIPRPTKQGKETPNSSYPGNQQPKNHPSLSLTHRAQIPMPDQSTFLLDELSMLGRPDFHENTLPSFLPSFFSLLLSPAFFHCREAFPLTVSRFPVTIPQCKKKKKKRYKYSHPPRTPPRPRSAPLCSLTGPRVVVLTKPPV